MLARVVDDEETYMIKGGYPVYRFRLARLASDIADGDGRIQRLTTEYFPFTDV